MKRRSGAEVVVITGASAGVGRAAARLFARRGAAIALVAASLVSFSIAERRYSARYITLEPSAAGD